MTTGGRCEAVASQGEKAYRNRGITEFGVDPIEVPTTPAPSPIAAPGVLARRGWRCRAFGRRARRGILRASNAGAATRDRRRLAIADAGACSWKSCQRGWKSWNFSKSRGTPPGRFSSRLQIARKYRGYCRSHSQGVFENESDAISHAICSRMSSIAYCHFVSGTRRVPSRCLSSGLRDGTRRVPTTGTVGGTRRVPDTNSSTARHVW